MGYGFNSDGLNGFDFAPKVGENEEGPGCPGAGKN